MLEGMYRKLLSSFMQFSICLRALWDRQHTHTHTNRLASVFDLGESY